VAHSCLGTTRASPRLVDVFVSRRPGAYRFAERLSLCLLGGLGLLFGLILFFSAPLLVHVILGDAFRGSVAALRVFSLWIPLVALSTALTFQLLLPDQLDYQFDAVVISAGLLGFGSALLLAPSYQAVGIAWSAVIGQLFSLIAFSVTRLG
jgi:O-antigen/teichoic acid export membrane protein